MNAKGVNVTCNLQLAGSYRLQLWLVIYTVASYPGLLTPPFVACSTNVGEGLVKPSHVQ